MAMTPEERRTANRRKVAKHRATHRKELQAKDSAHKREQYAEDPEAILAYNRAWYLANHETVNARRRAKNAADPEPARRQARARRAANGDTINAQRRAKRAADPEKVRATQRAHRSANREAINAQTRGQYHADPARKMAYNAKHRAAKANAPLNDLTHAQWLEIQEAQQHRCYYCGKRCKGKLTQDHIQALSQGGSHTLHNVIGACRNCNSRKGTGPPLVPVQPLLLTVAPSKKKKAA